jgi:hypothetical protein
MKKEIPPLELAVDQTARQVRGHSRGNFNA